jgi:hypothetical protein
MKRRKENRTEFLMIIALVGRPDAICARDFALTLHLHDHACMMPHFSTHIRTKICHVIVRNLCVSIYWTLFNYRKPQPPARLTRRPSGPPTIMFTLSYTQVYAHVPLYKTNRSTWPFARWLRLGFQWRLLRDTSEHGGQASHRRDPWRSPPCHRSRGAS